MDAGIDTDDELLSTWESYCDEMKTLGRAVLASPHAFDDVSRAEGMRHLARMVAMSLTQQIDFADSSKPRLFRSNDDVWQWGGPNVDNVYLGAPLVARGTYRLTGDISSQPGAILQIHGIPAPDEPIAVRADVNLVDFADPAGRIDIVVSGHESMDAQVRLAPDSQRVILREYVPTLETRRARFSFERIDASHAVVDLTPAVLARSFDSSRRWLVHNIGFWQDYTERRCAEVGINCLEQPNRGPGMGSESIAYSTGFYSLADDECLVISIEVPQARYWALQLYSMGWYEALDVTHRQTSLNNHQSHVDTDGKVRFVITAHDPGVPNWLDCGGHPRGMIHFRAVWCEELPTVSAEVVATSKLREALPGDHPMVTGEQRAAALVERWRIAQQRFGR